MLDEFDFQRILDEPDDPDIEVLDLNHTMIRRGHEPEPDETSENELVNDTFVRKNDTKGRATHKPRNVMLLQHSTISEDYSDEIKVRRKLHYAMNRTTPRRFLPASVRLVRQVRPQIVEQKYPSLSAKDQGSAFALPPRSDQVES